MKWYILSYFCFILISPRIICNKIETKEEFLTIKTRMDLQNFSKDCKKYIKKELRKNWKIHKTGKCYFQDDSTRIKVYDMQNCFIGKSKEIIHDIFGFPNHILQTNLQEIVIEEYNLKKDMLAKYSYSNWELNFYYQNQFLKKITMGQVSFD